MRSLYGKITQNNEIRQSQHVSSYKFRWKVVAANMYRSLKSGAAVACVAFHTTSVSAAAVNTTQGIYLDPTVTNNSLVSFPGFTVIGYGLNIFQLQPFDASTVGYDDDIRILTR